MSEVENILARNRQLGIEGIPEPERERALIAEFKDPVIADDLWNNQPQENVLPKLTLKIPDTGYPPKVMDRVDIPGPFDNDGFDHKNPDPQGFAGGRNLDDLSQYKTNAPENKVIKSQLVYDPMYDAISNDPNSEPSMHGEYGFNVAKAIPEWRYDVEQDQGGVSESEDKSLPQVLDHQREEYLQKQSDGYVEMPHVVVAPPEMPDEPHVVVEQEALEPLWGKYHLGPKHPRSDICDKFQMKVYDLNNEKNRPVPPSEGLGWTNTHPNCHCYWRIIKKPSKTAKATKPQIKQFQKINRLIGQKARYGTLHKVHADGKLYKTMTHKNVREALMEIRDEFSWLQPQYLDKIRSINAPGRMYLIRASEEAITDHRSEGEPLRRWLSPDELHAMARTAVKKGMDINHHPEWRTNSEVLDSEYDKMLKQIQMIVYEEDQEINDAIQRGDITAVSINGGSPRNESIQCPACQSSTNCECFIVPEGVILGEADDIALTWVVTNPTGMMWHGQFIPPATPGVKTTAIEPL
ncbi:hypothetical protein IIB34_06065 [PVC group bacterium]|nr:hypothetical protein [PVC group bacterium]